MPEKIKITIDDKTVEIKQDTFLLDAIREVGIEVPTLCYHKDLSPSGSCRLCVCEIEDKRGKKKLVTSCNYPVRDVIKVSTASEKVLKHRKILAEMYLGRWPNVKVVQEIAAACGVTESRFASELTDDNEHACILCDRCVRACREFPLENVLDFAGRGILRHLTMPFGEVDRHCIGCSSCAYVCPTGAIRIVDDFNHPVDPRKIRDHGMKVNAEMARLDDSQCCMRQVGTANIVEVMDKYDLLPCHNYKFGSLPDAKNIYSNVFRDNYWDRGMADGCWLGCSMACAKATSSFELKTGPYQGQKVCVDGPEYETIAGAANMGCFDPQFTIEFNFYCDTYGIDTISAATTIAFVMEAFENGVINTDHTGGLELNFGACDEVLELLHQMAIGEGFGVDVGQGIKWLKNKWTAEYDADAQFLNDIGMEVKGLEVSEYVSKESLAQQGGYAMAIKGPQHDEAWLIFMDMVNKQIPTFQDKAEALFYFPLWRTWFGLFGLCKILWNDIVPTDNRLEKDAQKVPGHVRNYFRYVEGMLGIDRMDEQKMLDQSARVYNLQRIMSFMLGCGQRSDDYPPYRLVGPVTAEEYESRCDRYDSQISELIQIDPHGKSTEEKIKILRQYRQHQYEQLMDVVYKRRGWTPNGIPTIARLKELGIDLPELVEIVKPYQG
jgi:aldehyde:ferredoxin oxidoreductase